jgi:hypothetical protein
MFTEPNRTAIELLREQEHGGLRAGLNSKISLSLFNPTHFGFSDRFDGKAFVSSICGGTSQSLRIRSLPYSISFQV